MTDDDPIVLYKIIDIHGTHIYVLQCVNSKSIFQADISEIISDTDILYNLHPIQSCFIGLEYANYLKTKTLTKVPSITEKPLSKKNSKPLEGDLTLKHQDRRGDICYIDHKTNEEFVSSPKDIVSSNHLIERFHADEAFYIGLCAGIKINRSPDNVIYLNSFDIPPCKATQQS